VVVVKVLTLASLNVICAVAAWLKRKFTDSPVVEPPKLIGPEVFNTDVYVKTLLLVAVPPGAVTTIVAAPTEPAGVTQVMVVELTTTLDVAGVALNVTLVAPVKFVPVMVTEVPPAVGPVGGEHPVIVGAGSATYSRITIP
jgi:hypothetical protein